MGSFSWLRADTLTEQANICYDDGFKFLIPKEFGGGYFRDDYRGYGQMKVGEHDFDIYEILAFWNQFAQIPPPIFNSHKKQFANEYPVLWLKTSDKGSPDSSFFARGIKKADEFTAYNRIIGIELACYDEDMARLPFPLKLVSLSFKGTYEDCPGISFYDPNQGGHRLMRRSQECQLLEKRRVENFFACGIPPRLALLEPEKQTRVKPF